MTLIRTIWAHLILRLPSAAAQGGVQDRREVYQQGRLEQVCHDNQGKRAVFKQGTGIIVMYFT